MNCSNVRLSAMGITLAEQKHLLKKMSLPAVELTPFEIHELFVNAAATETPCPGR